MADALNETEEKMLKFVAKTIDQHGYQPSMREIADELGYSGAAYVPRLVASCMRKGVVREQRGARAIVFDWRDYR